MLRIEQVNIVRYEFIKGTSFIDDNNTRCTRTTFFFYQFLSLNNDYHYI